MIKVGLTGGIGSGKSTCARIFELLGIPVYYSDQRAKHIMVKNDQVRSKILSIFGDKSYLPSGNLDRPYLAKMIFEDEQLLKKMNAIVHPAVKADFAQWMAVQPHVPYIIQESALLFETGSYILFDKIIFVDAPLELRIKRIISRDSVDRKDVLKRMQSQLPTKEKIEKSNYIIKNDGRRPVLNQIIHIHKALLACSSDF